MNIETLLSRRQTCTQCKGRKTVPHGPWVAYRQHEAIKADCAHQIASPNPVRREEAAKMLRRADADLGRGYCCGPDGKPHWRIVDGGELVPCPEEVKCNVCDGTGVTHIPPNPFEVRAILASQQREIAALRAAIAQAGIVIPRAPDNG